MFSNFVFPRTGSSWQSDPLMMKVRKKCRERKMKLDWIFDFSSTEIEVHSDDKEFFLKTFNPLKRAHDETESSLLYFIISCICFGSCTTFPFTWERKDPRLMCTSCKTVLTEWHGAEMYNQCVSDRHKGIPLTQFGYPDIKTVNEFIRKFCQALLFTNSFISISVFHFRKKKLEEQKTVNLPLHFKLSRELDETN